MQKKKKKIILSFSILKFGLTAEVSKVNRIFTQKQKRNVRCYTHRIILEIKQTQHGNRQFPDKGQL